MKMQTDYLIVGAGAMGMAFADTLLTEKPTSILRSSIGIIGPVDCRRGPSAHARSCYWQSR